jgi:hypothetical protein
MQFGSAFTKLRAMQLRMTEALGFVAVGQVLAVNQGALEKATALLPARLDNGRR